MTASKFICSYKCNRINRPECGRRDNSQHENYGICILKRTEYIARHEHCCRLQIGNGGPETTVMLSLYLLLKKITTRRVVKWLEVGMRCK